MGAIIMQGHRPLTRDDADELQPQLPIPISPSLIPIIMHARAHPLTRMRMSGSFSSPSSQLRPAVTFAINLFTCAFIWRVPDCLLLTLPRDAAAAAATAAAAAEEQK